MEDRRKTAGSLALQEKQPRVITIEATQPQQAAKLRVAAYARVSSSSDDQLNSFGAQNRYYTDYITSQENWSLVDVYADEGICPKGWRLPTGGSSGEFNTLYGQYNSAALMQGEPNFTLSGDVYDGSVLGQGDYGLFWSSTVRNAVSAYDLYLDSSNVFPGDYDDKYIGYSVRCVAI